MASLIEIVEQEDLSERYYEEQMHDELMEEQRKEFERAQEREYLKYLESL